MKKFNIILIEDYYEIYLNRKTPFDIQNSLAYKEPDSTIRAYTDTKINAKFKKDCSITLILNGIKIKEL